MPMDEDSREFLEIDRELRLLFYEITKGDFEFTKLILNASPHLIRVTHQIDPLTHAVHEGNTEIVQYLLEQYRDFYLSDQYEQGPLVAASFRDNLALVNALLEYGFDPNQGDSGGTNAIAVARSEAVIQRLLNAGADINHRDDDGETPLFTLVFGDPDILRFAIHKGADVNARDDWGRSLIGHAIHGWTDEAVIILLESGARMPEYVKSKKPEWQANPVWLDLRSRLSNPGIANIIQRDYPDTYALLSG